MMISMDDDMAGDDTNDNAALPPSCSDFCGGDQFFFELRVTVLIMTFLSRRSVSTPRTHTHTHTSQFLVLFSKHFD